MTTESVTRTFNSLPPRSRRSTLYNWSTF